MKSFAALLEDRKHIVKMFLIGTAVFVLCFSPGPIHCESSIETASVYVNQSCAPYETECTLGCCPFAQAVCCKDGMGCCQQGETCIPVIGMCIGAVNNNGEISLTSTKSTLIRSSVFRCPSGMTECAPGKCCPLEHAVCCFEGNSCCPHGYRCDLAHDKCIKTTTINESGRNFYSAAAFDKPLRKMSEKSPYKSCPGGSRLCPNYMSCCIHDNGGWGCCPNPSLPEIRYGGGECCDTIFGHMCCPDDFPICTIFGCTNR